MRVLSADTLLLFHPCTITCHFCLQTQQQEAAAAAVCEWRQVPCQAAGALPHRSSSRSCSPLQQQQRQQARQQGLLHFPRTDPTRSNRRCWQAHVCRLQQQHPRRLCLPRSGSLPQARGPAHAHWPHEPGLGRAQQVSLSPQGRLLCCLCPGACAPCGCMNLMLHAFDPSSRSDLNRNAYSSISSPAAAVLFGKLIAWAKCACSGWLVMLCYAVFDRGDYYTLF